MTNETLKQAIGCFEAAMVEGLIEVLAETTDERLKDLVIRRLMYAEAYVISAIDAEQAKGREAVASKAKFFNYGVDSGFDTHETAEQAKTAAENDLQCYRDEAGEGWAEEAERVCWGVILSETIEVDIGPAPEGSEFDKWIDYQLTTPTAQPAREWVGLTEDDVFKSVKIMSVNGEYLGQPMSVLMRIVRAVEEASREKNAGQPVVKEQA